MLGIAKKPALARLRGRYGGNIEAHTNRTQAACEQAFTLIAKDLTMTTKILTVRVPAALYASLCRAAGELGVPISAHVRRQLERENDALQLAALREELLARLDGLTLPVASSGNTEILLLCRAVAAHLNPQLVAQVRAKLALPQ
jgi:hypothetical protein